MITYKVKHLNLMIDVMIPQNKNGITVIILPGLPMSLGKNIIYNKLVEGGFLVMAPYYSGSYDSGGEFSISNCISDVSKVIKLTKRQSVKEIYFNEEIDIKNEKTFLIASSFGGSVALCSGRHLLGASGMILLSPVIEYNQNMLSKIESIFDFKDQMKHLLGLLKRGHRFSYRIKNYNNLRDFVFGRTKLKPSDFLNSIRTPTLIVHGKCDTSIPFTISKYYETIVCNDKISWLYPDRVGHSMSSYDEETINEIFSFIKKG